MNMKKIFLIVFSFCCIMIVGVVTSDNAQAATTIASGTCGNNLKWSLDSSGELSITGTGAMYNYDNQYYSDATSLPPWNKLKSLIKKVSVNGGTSIGNCAFMFLSELTEVNISNGVKNIGEDAFETCSKLEKVSMSDSVFYIGDGAFEECVNLYDINISSNLIEIGKYAFRECKLNSLQLPETLITIRDGAFWLSSLESIVIPKSVVSVAPLAFGVCDALKTVVIQGSTIIEEDAFVASYGDYHIITIYYTDEFTGNQSNYEGNLTWVKIDTDYKFGDLNFDSQINSDDAIYLLMHTQFPSDYPLPDGVNYDLNNDSQINSDDAIYLLMHTQFPTDYPLDPKYYAA